MVRSDLFDPETSSILGRILQREQRVWQFIHNLEEPYLDPYTPYCPAECEQHELSLQPEMPPSLATVPFVFQSSESAHLDSSPGPSGQKPRKGTITYKDDDYLRQLRLRDIDPTPDPSEDATCHLSNLGALRKSLEGPVPLAKNKEECDTAIAIGQRAQNEATFGLTLWYLLDLKSFVRIDGLRFVLTALWDDTYPLPPTSISSRIAAPCPNVTIGYHYSVLAPFGNTSLGFGSISTPVICDRDIHFPFVTNELKKDADWDHLELQNSYDGAIMLRNLRLLRQNGYPESVKHDFDNSIRALTIGINKTIVVIYGHWTTICDGRVQYRSAPLRKWSLNNDDDAWHEAQAGIRLAIVWMMEQNISWIKADLATVEHRNNGTRLEDHNTDQSSILSDMPSEDLERLGEQLEAWRSETVNKVTGFSTTVDGFSIPPKQPC